MNNVELACNNKRSDENFMCCNSSSPVTHDVREADLLSSAGAMCRVSGVRLTCSVELAYAEDCKYRWSSATK